MGFQRRLCAAICAAAVGCGGEGITPPSDADRAAAELERAAADMGFAAGPTGALTMQTAAAALRGGARPSTVDITVDGATDKWSAFAHELVLELPPDLAFPGSPPPAMRTLLAWRSTSTGFRFIHLLAESDRAEIGDPFVDPGDELPAGFPALLIYSEARNLVWEGVSGEQTSDVSRSTTPCPMPRRPAGAPQGPQCVEASFTFSFSGVEAPPMKPIPTFLPVPTPTNLATGTRSLSMTPQTVAGVSMKLTLPVIDIVTVPNRAPR